MKAGFDMIAESVNPLLLTGLKPSQKGRVAPKAPWPKKARFLPIFALFFETRAIISAQSLEIHTLTFKHTGGKR